MKNVRENKFHKIILSSLGKKLGIRHTTLFTNSALSEVAVSRIMNKDEIIQVAKNVKMHGGVGSRVVQLSHDANDSLNKSINNSAKLIKTLSR